MHTFVVHDTAAVFYLLLNDSSQGSMFSTFSLILLTSCTNKSETFILTPKNTLTRPI